MTKAASVNTDKLVNLLFPTQQRSYFIILVNQVVIVNNYTNAVIHLAFTIAMLVVIGYIILSLHQHCYYLMCILAMSAQHARLE